MEKKIISIKQLQYEKLYKDFYSKYDNVNLSLHCFFKSDVTYNKTKIS
jgi:hypothetical protein